MKTKLLLLFILTFTLFKVNAQVPSSERSALIALYNSTDGANWTDSTNWNTAQPVANWFGITVTNVSGTDHVTNITMQNNNLVGALPTEIGDFPELTTLFLYNHSGLTGTIPTQITSLSKLANIAFVNNNMSGIIPTAMPNMSSLINIYLAGNEFTGPVPNFTTNTIGEFWIDNNRLEFGDFENEFTIYQGMTTGFNYMPQNQFYEDVVTEEAIGSTFTLTTNVSGVNNNYQWYKVNTSWWSTNIADATAVAGATNTSLTITNAQNDDFGYYYCVVTSTIVTGLEIKKEKIRVLQTVPSIERDALIALYNATDGPNWNNNTNWNTTEPVALWNGITVENGRVITINRYNNNLTGVLPVELQNLTALERLYLDRNNLSGSIPDLTGITSLDRLDINNNNYQFTDFENEFTTYQGFSYFFYSPQNKIAVEEIHDLVVGNTYNMIMPVVSGTGVSYQWYKNDVAITGETNLTYSITNAQVSDAANYTCKASSPIVTDLTIDREFIHIYGTIDPADRNGLIALYNATDGPNWTNNTNWDTAIPVYDWFGVTVEGTKVVSVNLPSNNLVGTVPAQIGDLSLLKEFTIYSNSLTNIDLSNCTSLLKLNCGSNPITTLNLLNNTNLTKLSCSSTQITSLDLSQNVALKTLYANFCPVLASVDLSQNIALENGQTGICDVLTSLDFSNCPNLEWFNCSGNPLLTNVNLKNGNNTNITGFYAGSSPNLTCIQVDDIAYANTQVTNGNWRKDDASYFETDCSSPATTNVPDDNFENYLETHAADGTVVTLGDATSMGDGIANNDLVISSKISVVTNLDVSNLTISSLVGIEDFTVLEDLRCNNNAITSIDISNNSALKTFYAWENHLAVIDVTQNLALEYLAVDDNYLTSIDVSQNTALTHLDLSNWGAVIPNNTITNLDLSNNPNLYNLRLYSLNIANLDITTNLNLRNVVNGYNTSLTNIDLTNNTLLNYIDFSNCALTNIDVSNNLSIGSLYIQNNNITGLLDLSTHNQLVRLDVSNNNLQELDLKNGATNNITNYNTTNNPILTCIQVDDVAFANTNFTNKDAGASFNTDCNFVLSVEEEYLNEVLSIYPNPSSGIVNIHVTNDVQIAQIEVYNMLGQKINAPYSNNTLSLSKLNSGMYLAVIYTNKGNITKRISKL